MAIKVAFEVSLSKQLRSALEKSSTPIDDATAKDVGDAVVQEMKAVIANGISPIDGVGKFPKYKNPQKYPGKRKSKTPVNLNLEGDFQNALTYSVTDGTAGKATAIFYEGSEELKEKGHREGANSQPKRPTIPASKGQNFSARIRLIYTNIIRERILKVLNGEG